MRAPDWLIYLLVVCAIVWVIFQLDDKTFEAPPSSPDSGADLGVLPPASVFDPEVLVEVGPVSSGVGTAFAIDRAGWWLTARHVVSDCKEVGLIVGRRLAAPVKMVKISDFTDLALLKTEKAPPALELDTSEDKLRIGQLAFHVGFPQGRKGEAVSRLYGREKLVARGRYNVEEPVLAWAEIGRTGGLRGSLAGISGGPVMDENGRVIGVTIAEAARRGRLYTSSPSTVKRLLETEKLSPKGEISKQMTRENYGFEADDLRLGRSVVQVVCVADDMALTRQ
jgi:S1-C subfamily serine protease